MSYTQRKQDIREALTGREQEGNGRDFTLMATGIILKEGNGH